LFNNEQSTVKGPTEWFTGDVDLEPGEQAAVSPMMHVSLRCWGTDTLMPPSG
jgi:hypothetical protein